MNYFEFYGISPKIFLDEIQLEHSFKTLSRQLHPDKYVTSSKAEQEVAIEITMLNNLAYKTLKDFNSRLKYILQMSDMISEDEKQITDSDFLMQMMDINDEINDLKENYNLEKLVSLQSQIETISISDLESMSNDFNSFDVSYDYSDYIFDLMCKKDFIKNDSLFDIFFHDNYYTRDNIKKLI